MRAVARQRERLVNPSAHVGGVGVVTLERRVGADLNCSDAI